MEKVWSFVVKIQWGEVLAFFTMVGAVIKHIINRKKIHSCMKQLRQDIIFNPPKYYITTPPYRWSYWAINNLREITIPDQIKPEKVPLILKAKEKFKRIYELLEEHNYFIKQAEDAEQSNIKNYFGGKQPEEIYNKYMAELLALTDKYERK